LLYITATENKIKGSIPVISIPLAVPVFEKTVSAVGVGKDLLVMFLKLEVKFLKLGDTIKVGIFYGASCVIVDKIAVEVGSLLDDEE
jgi:hypothetical protein